ncbi:MAG: 4'-phosphopantetheinyl transferase superfamily protein, partial [Waterburya sp.]
AIDTVWQDPSQPPILDNDQVHVWRANLDLPDADIVRLAAFLSPDELTRANKFRFPHLKRRFTAARGILRQLLGNYLSIKPNDLTFEYSDRGKPRLSSSKQDSLPNFNLSHSQEYALYGFTYHDPIGVDLEYIREMPDALKIAQRFFSAREYQLIKDAASKEQPALFFKLWTAKEAYLKAVGTGLAGSLDSVDIEFNLARSPRLQAIQGDKAAAADWSLYPCLPATDYVGAIAIKIDKSPKQISFWHWHQV